MIDPEREAQKKAADALWSKYIRLRDRDTCQRCRRPGNQPHHIFSRRHLGTRHDPENGVLLCFYCHHVIAHSDYETIREFHLKKLGEDNYKRLRLRAYALTKPDYKLSAIILRQLILEEEERRKACQSV
jgi:5-methylcytosine-specific restriction endonuclease McrA